MVSESTPVSLVRYHWFSEAATLVPGTSAIHVFQRERRQDGPPYFVPEVLVQGTFDFIGGTLVALYRAPDENAALRFQLGDRAIEIGDSTRSTFAPTFVDGEPLIENSDVDRRFALREGERLLVEHAYRLDDREKRLYFSIDPFPSWPDEEADYDLCYLVHRMVSSGGWRRAFRSARRQ
jgi:hypothetical protein